ncbi:hypothetical protein KSS87_021751 [Heliosperma pusillum]|nr:hypothetical protein KSS87_021751 [Heliosperma pusillum]
MSNKESSPKIRSTPHKSRHGKIEEEDDEFDAEKFHKEAWLEGGLYECQARVFAEASLRYLQAHTNNYQLVKLGSSSAAFTFCGPLIHANFQAKPKDSPAAPVETFFSQLRQTRVLVVDCCVSLGPSEELPHWENADLRGCKYCSFPIHHPSENCEKLIKSKHDDVSWLYGDDVNVSSSESD